MADHSAIEWTEATWNPTTGCTRVSPGCDHCYIERTVPFRVQRRRFDGPGTGATTGVKRHSDRLHLPLRWRKPRRVFVNSLSDLFHEQIPDEFIAEVFAVMALTARHTYQLLTKRHARILELLGSEDFVEQVAVRASGRIGSTPSSLRRQLDLGGQRLAGDSGLGGGWTTTPTPAGTLWTPPWPLPNVWLGVSVESQKWADIRIPALLETPAAIRFLSCEPLLGAIGLKAHWLRPTFPGPRVNWVIAGGESGPDARPMHPDWVRSLQRQCAAAGTAFFFKQWGEWAPLGPLYPQSDDYDEESEDARMEAAFIEVDDGKRVIELERSGYIVEGHQPGDSRTWLMARLGKKAAGRELDGHVHDEYPAVGRG